MSADNSTKIDLSVHAIPPDADWNDKNFFDAYINKLCDSKIGWGGYLENREFYKRSAVFSGEETHRNIHLGVDLWMPENTPVYAIEKGEVYGFAYNDNPADYGHTIIVKHEVENSSFFSLYGHLSSWNFDKLQVGKPIAKGQKIAELGGYHENGNWPPHLHFQLITDMHSLKSDFPGVCFEWQQPYFEEVCPNPTPFILAVD